MCHIQASCISTPVLKTLFDITLSRDIKIIESEMYLTSQKYIFLGNHGMVDGSLNMFKNALLIHDHDSDWLHAQQMATR